MKITMKRLFTMSYPPPWVENKKAHHVDARHIARVALRDGCQSKCSPQQTIHASSFSEAKRNWNDSIKIVYIYTYYAAIRTKSCRV